jgi:hypothetical protein
MELQHINVKIFVDGELAIDPAKFIDVFHAWVRDHTLDELLIDVADYRHVPAGPGVMLIGHEADYSMDHADGRWGLRYNRKAAVDGSNDDCLRQALRSAGRACQLLEEHFKGEPSLLFSRREFELFVNDRALAPNTPEILATSQPILESFLTSALGHDDFRLEPRPDPRSLFGVSVAVAQPFELTEILETLAP